MPPRQPRLPLKSLSVARLSAPSGGIDVTSTPDYLGGNQAAKLENFMSGDRGKSKLRAPVFGLTTVPSPITRLRGHFAWGSEILINKTSNVSKDQTWLGCTVGPSTLHNFASASAVTPCGASPLVGLYSYAINAFSGLLEVARWDGGNLLVLLTNAPYGSQALASHLGRLWAFGGTVPGTGAAGPQHQSSLYWTDIGGSTADALAEWEDDVSGLVNRIDLDGNITDQGRGLAVIGRNLALIRQNSVWLLTGDSPQTFSVRRVADMPGVTPLYTPVMEWDGRCFWMTTQGLVMFDGVNVSLVSGPIRAALGSYLYNGTFSLARVSASTMMLVADSSTASYAALFNVDTNTWSEWTCSTSIFPHGAPRYCGNTGATAFAWTGTAVATLSVNGLPLSLTEPDVLAASTDAGTDDPRGTPVAVPARYWSRVESLSAPLAKAQLHRIAVEYAFRYASITGTPLTISAYDGQGTQLMASKVLTGQTTATPLQRQRAVFDCHAEATDVQIRVEYANAAADNVTELEVYDAWVEFARGHDTL